jgi:hypothetical protein
VDRAWADDIDHMGNSYELWEFSAYPLLGKYFSGIRFIGGELHPGLNWIHQDGDGGPFDPNKQVESLEEALDSKLRYYATSEKQTHLKAQGLTQLHLLVHGGFNNFAYNTPSGHLSLSEISQHGADYYAAHENGSIFDYVWFSHSLEPHDELNQQIGFAPGEGRVCWLAQIWPQFRILPGSFEK